MSAMKAVVCVFKHRRKKIEFSGDGCDVTNLKAAFKSAAQNDSEMLEKLKVQPNFVLQMIDKDCPQLGLVDIEMGEEIPNGTEVHAVFPLATENTKSDVNVANVIEHEQVWEVKDLHFGSISVPSTSSVIPVEFVMDHNESTEPMTKNRRASNHMEDAEMSSQSKMDSEHKDKQSVLLDSDKNDSDLDDLDNSNEKVHRKKPVIQYPTSLPSLKGTGLENITSDDDILKHDNRFIRHWASHLCHLTDGRPLRTDYQNYAKTIVKHYPILGVSVVRSPHEGATPELNYRPVVKKLSNCIRNRRIYIHSSNSKGTGATDDSKKRDTKSEGQQCQEMKKEKKKEQKKEQQKDPKEGCPSREPPANAEQLLSVLKEANTRDLTHAKVLLQKTYALRRKWIQKEAKGFRNITEEYPVMKNIDLMLYDFELMGYTATTLTKKFSALMGRLSLQLRQPAETDADQLHLLETVETELQPNKLAAQANKVITTKKIYGKLGSLKSDEQDSLRLVAFLDVTQLKTAYLLGDNVSVEIEEPSAMKCVMVLMAAYYVFDCSFSTAHKNFLTYLDVHVLGKDAPKNPTVKYTKFTQKMSAKKKIEF